MKNTILGSLLLLCLGGCAHTETVVEPPKSEVCMESQKIERATNANLRSGSVEAEFKVIYCEQFYANHVDSGFIIAEVFDNEAGESQNIYIYLLLVSKVNDEWEVQSAGPIGLISLQK